MGEKTGISWTEKTWNPIQGCHKISPGCKNCYMFSEKQRYGQDPNVVVRSSDATFYAPLRWKESSLIFTCSWSDWFIEDADQWRDEMWSVVRRTPQHTYQILTKRAGRIKDHLPSDWGSGWPNVWLGVSVEQQAEDWRIRELIDVPAALRFLSLEPLLGPIENGGACADCGAHRDIAGRCLCVNKEQIDWVIIGGESDGLHGTNARECSLDWIHSLTEQCSAAGVPFFVKQLGAKPYYLDEETKEKKPYHIKSKKGDDPQEFPCHFLQDMPDVWRMKMEQAEARAIEEAVNGRK